MWGCSPGAEVGVGSQWHQAGMWVVRHSTAGGRGCWMAWAPSHFCLLCRVVVMGWNSRAMGMGWRKAVRMRWRRAVGQVLEQPLLRAVLCYGAEAALLQLMVAAPPPECFSCRARPAAFPRVLHSSLQIPGTLNKEVKGGRTGCSR